MKKISLVFIAAAVIGVCSAFGTASKGGTIYVEVEPGVFMELSQVQDEGECIPNDETHCEFLLKENGNPQNPNDYEPAPWDVDRLWQFD